MRLSAVFVPLCMVVIAASLGAAAYLALAIAATEAAAVSLTALSALIAWTLFSGRAQERAEVSRQITGLSRGTAGLARQVGDLARRVIAIEGALATADEQARAAVQPLSAEIEVLGTLVTQLAESVDAHEGALLAQSAPPAMSAQPMMFAAVPAAPASVAVEAPTMAHIFEPISLEEIEAFDPPPMPERALGGGIEPGVIGQIRAALEANRVDLYLQPIVTLPQRKIRHYQAIARLRAEDGAPVMLPEGPSAESERLLLVLDNLMLLRAAQVVRRLLAKNRDAALIYGISGWTLANPSFVSQLSEFLSTNRQLAPALTFGVAQSALRGMRAAEKTAMAHIAGLGFRFALEHMDDLRFDPRELATLGFRFVKPAAALLLDRSHAAAGNIHTADLANLMSRFGIDLIAGEVETEGTVVDLLDYEIGFGQGTLFSPPRPVRAEVFEAAAAGKPNGAAPQPRGNNEAVAARATAAERPAPAPGLAKLARSIMRRA